MLTGKNDLEKWAVIRLICVNKGVHVNANSCAQLNQVLSSVSVHFPLPAKEPAWLDMPGSIKQITARPYQGIFHIVGLHHPVRSILLICRQWNNLDTFIRVSKIKKNMKVESTLVSMWTAHH